MTIHAAKGLEFPIVIVSGMSSRPGGSPRRRRGAVAARRRLRAQARARTCRPSDFEAAKPLDEQMDYDERLRLLYVACTRARTTSCLAAPQDPHAASRPTTATSRTPSCSADASTGRAVLEAFDRRRRHRWTPSRRGQRPCHRRRRCATGTPRWSRPGARRPAGRRQRLPTEGTPTAAPPHLQPTDGSTTRRRRPRQGRPRPRRRRGTRPLRHRHRPRRPRRPADRRPATGAGLDDAVAAQATPRASPATPTSSRSWSARR